MRKLLASFALALGLSVGMIVGSLDITVNNLVWAPQNTLTYPQARGTPIAANTFLC